MRLDGNLLARTLWFLDYDGSVCPHLEVWEDRLYDPVAIYRSVDRLRQKSAGVFWNTGRRPESLAGVYPAFLSMPGYFIQGSCLWSPPDTKQFIGPLVPPSLVTVATEFVKANPQFKLEIKPTSLRITPYEARLLKKLDRALDALRLQTPEGWFWLVGNRGAELLARGHDKATAIQREFAKNERNLLPVAVGDDILDRPAIEESLRRGGFAVIVGGGCGWITEVPHQSDQLIFCEEPQSALDLFDDLSG